MSYIAQHPEEYKDKPVGNGHCAVFVQVASGAPLTKDWNKGIQVKGAQILKGTAIATFDPNGKYGNHTDGRSHAAIYIGQAQDGIEVWEQWVGHPVSTRTIRFPSPYHKQTIKQVNDGNQYYVID